MTSIQTWKLTLIQAVIAYDPNTKVRSCCGQQMYVIDTRETSLGVRRRRECGECGRRVTTYEVMMRDG